MCKRFAGNFAINGIEATSMANEGVGRPLNSFICSVILKIASLIAEKIIIKNETNGNISISLMFLIRENIMNVGAKPKLTKSERESICLPNSDCAFNFRAKNPSKKSKTDDTKTKMAEIYKFSGFVSAK